MTEEIWKKIHNYPGYEVSNLGRVRSFRRLGAARNLHGFKLEPHFLRQNNNKYKMVVLCNDQGKAPFLVHRLVLTAFVGDPEPGKQCGHRNGIRYDNRLENLAWITCSENQNDRKLHGTLPFGESHGMSKLDDNKVREIFRLRASKMTHEQIGQSIGVGQSTICKVLNRKYWKHVDVVDRGHIGRFLKLSESDLDEAERLMQAGVTCADLARKFGVSYNAIPNRLNKRKNKSSIPAIST